MEKFKKEILKTEENFVKAAAEKGVKEAFLMFAGDDAVLNRGGRIISGKNAISKFFDEINFKVYKLDWKADFADVSLSGDLGYTYGRYTSYTVKYDGTEENGKGIFHTVWKRQKDGSWKFVYD